MRTTAGGAEGPRIRPRRQGEAPMRTIGGGAEGARGFGRAVKEGR